VCDPDTGMHRLFSGLLAEQIFVDSPRCAFDEPPKESDLEPLRSALESRHQEIAALILEPIVQGAGGMRFYSPGWLKAVRGLCDDYNVLLILDEIATGFGRTGKLFACEHAGIAPDIMCIGKALTGGYMTLAATLTTEAISRGICDGTPGVLMHGPTFMANPLACSAALTSIDLLLSSPWQEKVSTIEKHLREALAPARALAHIEDVRVLGAIGVIEAKTPVRMQEITRAFVDKGVWLRPFGKLVYVMPPFIIESADLQYLAETMLEVVQDPHLFESP